jgi:CRP-like cAMP-binding protein
MTSTAKLVEMLAPDLRERLLALGYTARFEPHTRIFEEGARADRFWLLNSGAVHLDAHVPGAHRAVVDVLGPGDLLGWSWMFPPYRWHLGAEAVGHVTAVAFDAEQVRQVCRDDPEFGQAMVACCAQVIAGRLHATRTRLLNLYGPHGASVR